MSHEAADFTGELKDCKRVIKGFGGTRHYNIKVGTIKWHWEDDHGRIHKFTIPQSYFVPEGGVRLLSPQHWAQTQNDTKPISGTREFTDHKSCTLQWKQRQFQRTVTLNHRSNVASFRMAPGFRKFEEYEVR